MRYYEIKESLSRVVYHYTTVYPALNIVTSGKFQLSSALGSIEEKYAPIGYPYFLSTTRTKLGGYHKIIGDNAVMFQLDGNYYNNRYPSKSVDYWGNRDTMVDPHNPHEAEDRLYSKEPTIPSDGITAIYVYVGQSREKTYVNDTNPRTKAVARNLLIASKKRGIQTYFYTDPKAWKNLDKRTEKRGDISTLQGELRTGGGYVSTHKGYLFPWVELVFAKDKSQLSKKANAIRYNLVYDRYIDGAISVLKNEFSNARKPNSGRDRKHVVNLIGFMKQNRIYNIDELVKFIADKWKAIG